MKNFFYQAILILWSYFFVNSAIAIEKKYSGKGDLYLSKKMISNYFNYVTQPSDKIPLVFFITKDEKNFYSTIINNDGGGYAESNTIEKKKIRCEKKFQQECNLFSNMTFIVWDNGKNLLNENVSIIDRKISRENLIFKLTELGFVIDKKKLAVKNVKDLKKKVNKELKITKKKAAKKEKLVKEKKDKKDNEKEKIEKKLSLIPPETELEIAQNFLNNMQQFIKLYPDVFDIVKVSEFFILTKSILDGNLNYKLEEDLKNFKEFTNSSEKFVKYNNDVETKKRNKELKKIDEAILELENYVKSIKGFMIDNPNSIYLEKWLINIKIANETLDSPESYEKLISINDGLKKIINEKNELDSVIAELKYTIDELKENLKVNLTTDLAPLIIEQIKSSDQAIKSEKIENIISANKVSKDFLLKKIEEPKLKTVEKKKVAKKKENKQKAVSNKSVKKEPAKTDFKGAISIFGLSVAMDMQANVAAAEAKGYKCQDILEMKTCKGKGVIEITSDVSSTIPMLTFNCATYGGCVYDLYEAGKFIGKKLNVTINNPEVIGTYLPREAICGEGKAGDKICVVKPTAVTNPKVAGPVISLFKGKFGASGMSLD